MDTPRSNLELMNLRRMELGMSYAALANRSGVSSPTVHRILSGDHEGARYSNVLAIAGALGVRLRIDSDTSSECFRQQNARRKAQRLVGMVQATSALEGQAVRDDTVDGMVLRTVHELCAGPSRKLWAKW